MLTSYTGSMGPFIRTFLKDAFTDANGTALPAHTMDVGSGWVEYSGTGQIQSNQLAAVTMGGLGEYVAAADAGDSGVISNVDLILVSADLTVNSHFGLVARLSDVSNFWIASLIPSQSLFTITEVVAGTYTVRQSVAVQVTAGTYTIELVCSNNVLTATLNGGSQLQHAPGGTLSNQTATKFGCRLPNLTVRADNFLVTQL